MIVKIVIRCFTVSFLFFMLIIGAWMYYMGNIIVGISLTGVFVIFIVPVMYSLVYWGAYGERIQQAGMAWTKVEERIRKAILNASETGLNKVIEDLEKIGAKNTLRILNDVLKSE